MRGGLYNPRPVDDTPVNGQLQHGVTSNWAFDHAADLDAHTFDALTTLIVGYYYQYPDGRILSTNAEHANRLRASPLVIARDVTVDRIAIDVKVASGAGTKIRLGIYEDDGAGYPGDLVLDAGEVAADAVGIQAAVIDQALTKGLYWVVKAGNSTPTTYHLDTGTYGTFGFMPYSNTNFNAKYTNYSAARAYGALPTPYPAAAALDVYRGALCPVRIASLD